MILVDQIIPILRRAKYRDEVEDGPRSGSPSAVRCEQAFSALDGVKPHCPSSGVLLDNVQLKGFETDSPTKRIKMVASHLKKENGQLSTMA
jgi:hypothetical protein